MVGATAAQRDILGSTRCCWCLWAGRGGRLRGRRREQEQLGRLLTGIRSGRSGVLVVRGEAGIGKTALLEYLVERASGAWWPGRRACRPTWSCHSPGCSSCSGRCSARSSGSPIRSATPWRWPSVCARGRHRIGSWWAGGARAVGRGCRASAAGLRRRRRSVARPGLRSDAGVRRAAAPGRVGRLGFRGARASEDETFAGLPELVVGGPGRRRRARAAGRRRSPGRVDEPGDRPDRRRDARQPAGLARAAARTVGGRAGGRLRRELGAAALRSARAELPRRVRSMPEHTQRFLLLAAAEPVGRPGAADAGGGAGSGWASKRPRRRRRRA